jgi:DNA-3-methyladenine glycosylase II
MPYRLDLTVSVLRRLSTNVVDQFTPEGHYVRALSGFPSPVIVRATQLPDGDCLSITIESDGEQDPSVLALVYQMLGASRDLTDFDRSASHIPWLTPLVARMHGVNPPRYPTLWETCANAIIFQQVSLRSASAVMQRMVVAFGQAVNAADLPTPCYVFPSPEQFQEAKDELLRAIGLSTNKIATLRRVAVALASGMLDQTTLERTPSRDAAAILSQIKGIGPWTAALSCCTAWGDLMSFQPTTRV